MSEQVNMAAHYEHEIPEGYEAKIEGNKVIIELKESEDERIRKAMILYFQGIKDSQEAAKYYQGVDGFGRWIAYLEKHKEQSFTHHETDESLQDAVTHQMEDDGDVDDFVRRGIDDIALKYAMLGAQWQKEQNPTKKLSRDDYVKRFKALCDVYAIRLPNREYDIYHLCDDLSKLSMDSGKQQPNIEICPHSIKSKSYKENDYPVEQKPTEWSEKDEARKERLISIVKRALHGNEYCLLSDKGATELITWLKALHERFNLQSKQEWSKEDIAMLDLLRAYLNGDAQLSITTKQALIIFLNGLIPQPHWKQDGVWITKEQFEQIKSASYLTGKLDHWKPSKEQIAALNCAIQTTQHQLNFGDKRLLSLYDDLQKLM